MPFSGWSQLMWFRVFQSTDIYRLHLVKGETIDTCVLQFGATITGCTSEGIVMEDDDSCLG